MNRPGGPPASDEALARVRGLIDRKGRIRVAASSAIRSLGIAADADHRPWWPVHVVHVDNNLR